MKKLLYITHLSGKRVNRIWISSIMAAQELGYEFHLACNMAGAEHPGWEQDCKNWGIHTHQIDFNRNPLNLENIKAKKQLSELLIKEKFDVVHCNTPVGGLLGRICARECHVPHIIYQAHGFHFWKGAPLKNWLLYYPVEKWLSGKTDILITINKEDYERAKKRFGKARIEYVPGVGIDINKFSSKKDKREEKRHELHLTDNDFVLLSVGELIPRKNHIAVLRALSELKKTDCLTGIQYLICGNGSYMDELKEAINNYSISDHVQMLGFRKDISEICAASDLFVFPSLQEGLPLALMEAMACGMPTICSCIRGNTDLIDHGVEGEIANNSAEIAEAIIRLKNDRSLCQHYADEALKKIKGFDLDIIVTQMKQIYSSL